MLRRFINKLNFWYVDWKIAIEKNRRISKSEVNEIVALLEEYSKITQENASKLREVKLALRENGEALDKLLNVYKKPVNFHVEVDKDLMPSKEQLDANKWEGSKRFAEMYIKALQKNK